MKIESIQALRGVAFLNIFLSHCALAESGAIGVSLFFVMSGFLLVYNHISNEYNITFKNSIRFSFDRIKRIYLLHLVTTLAAFPFLIKATLEANEGIGYFLFRFFANIGLVQAWFPQENIRYSLNNLSWYLSVSTFLYFCFPFILKLIKRIKLKNITRIIIFSYLLQIIIGTIISSFFHDYEIIKGLTYNSPLFRIFDFFEGCLFGYIYIYNTKNSDDDVMEVILLAIYILISFFCFFSGYDKWWKITVAFLPIACFAVLFLARQKGYISRLLNNKAFIFLGNISAEMYLIHELIIRYLRILLRRININVDDFVSRLFIAIISFFLSYCSSILWRKICKLVKCYAK